MKAAHILVGLPAMITLASASPQLVAALAGKAATKATFALLGLGDSVAGFYT